MIRFAFLLLINTLLFTGVRAQMKSTTSKSQFTVQVDENTVVRDSLGNRVAFPVVMKLLAGGAYTLDPVRDKNGKSTEYKIRPVNQGDTGKRQTVMRTPSSENFSKPKVGDAIPAFSITSIDGKVYNLSNLKNKVVVINFWFTLCKPCLYEIPAMNEMAAAYASREDVLFLAPGWEKKDLIDKFIEKQKMSFVVFAEAFSLIDALKIRAYPTTIVVGKDGKITASYSGGLIGIENILKKDIDAALAK